MSIQVWFAYTLPSGDQYLNKAFMIKWKSFEQTCCGLPSGIVKSNGQTWRPADRQTDSSLLCHIPPVLSHGVLQITHHFLSSLLSEWVIWSVTHPLQSWAKLSKQRRRAGGGNWISTPPSPLKDRPPNPHQQELREPAVHQVSSATVVRPIRFLLLHTLHSQAWERMQTHQDARMQKKKKDAHTWT